jgi:pimeloyl-ACP methyl ester carboxylesterase
MYYFLLGDNTPCAFITSKQQNKEQQQKPLLVYYMGSGETLLDFLVVFRDIRLSNFWRELVKKYDILCPSLPGYFLNHTGDFSEKTRRSQIDYVFKWCQKNYQDNVYILGFSLGCYFAILLAGRGNCKFLFLSNPFLTDKTAARWTVEHTIGCCGCVVSPLYKSKLDNGEAIKQVKCPIDFYYALDDEIVNPKDARTLYDIANNNGNKHVSLLPHFNLSDDKDIPVKKSIVNKIKDTTCFWYIESLDNIIDSGKIDYSFNHCEICYSHGLFFRLNRCHKKVNYYCL